MAEKLGLGPEPRPLKIGQSFTNPKSSAFHSVKYDFKPASVDTTSKIATMDVGANHQVTITHLDGAGVPQTVFKGSQRPYQKECVLIIDRVTGEITLEKLACNIQVKKTRSESAKVPLPQDRLGAGGPADRSSSSSVSALASRSQTPPIGAISSIGQRQSNKTKVTSGRSRRPDTQITHLVPKHSPLHASPSYPSPGHQKTSPKRENHLHNNESTHNPSALASLPMIGIDDDFPMAAGPQNPLSMVPPPPPSNVTATSLPAPPPEKSPIFRLSDVENGIVGEITDSSSSSSDSDSDSDPDNTVVEKTFMKSSPQNGHHSNGLHNNPPPPQKSAAHLLNEDLCLSESATDSD